MYLGDKKWRRGPERCNIDASLALKMEKGLACTKECE